MTAAPGTHRILVQTADFDTGSELRRLQQATPDTGAVASFVGMVRNHNDGQQVAQLSLEHYPGMTERALADIAHRAAERWPLLGTVIIHRVGALKVGDQIVLVAVSAAHRAAAFDACRFIMDFLKTEAPFWKKENTPAGSRWVDARDSDEAARAQWSAPSDPGR